MNPNVQKRTYVVPIRYDRNARVTISDALEVDDGSTTFMWNYTPGIGVLVSSSCNAQDCTNEISQSVASLTALPYEAAEPLVRFWLSLLLNV
jgi:hypothetical protein